MLITLLTYRRVIFITGVESGCALVVSTNVYDWLP